jgi:hypothetical protein
MSHMVYSAYTRASPYPAIPHEIQIIRLTHFENSSAKDEGRALAARWRAEKCHSLICVPSPYLWFKLEQTLKKTTFNGI